MAPVWVDSHCHLDFPAFAADRAQVLARAHDAGVSDIVVPATHADHWDGVLALGATPGVHAALGLHPWWTAEHRDADVDRLREHLDAGRVVAVGECGLDFARDIDAGLQRHWFSEQLRLAADFEVPVIVHAVKALDRILHEMAAFPGIKGVIHGFAGSPQQAGRCIKAGLMLGIGPAVARSERLAAIVRDLPAEHLLLETDAPDRPLAGARGEPAQVARIGVIVAEFKRMAPAELAGITSANAQRLFGWGES